MSKTWKKIVTRRVSVFRSFVMARGSSENLKELLGIGADAFVVTKDGVSSYFLSFKDIAAISKVIISKLSEDGQYAEKHIKDCLHACKQLIETSKKSSSDLEDVVSLKSKFENYYGSYKRFAPYVIIPVAIEHALTKNITAYLESSLDSELVLEYMSKLFTSPKLPEVSKEQIALVSLAKDVVEKNIFDYKKSLDDHVGQFRWLSCYNIDEAAFGYTYFESRLKELVALGAEKLSEELDRAKQQHEEDNILFKKIIEELNPPHDILKQIELLREYVWLRTYRIEMQSVSNFYIQALFKHIADKFDRTLSEIVALSPEEIYDMLERNELPTASELQMRMQSYVLVSREGAISLVHTKQGEQIALKELGEKKEDDTGQLKGNPACKGVAKGRARIILKKEDIPTCKKGEILVTSMTTPEFVPAMKKAAAIVTDEGGLLCHAAIVAREMQKPCIIGTLKATEVFENGDMLEVDAEEGVVRKVDV